MSTIVPCENTTDRGLKTIGSCRGNNSSWPKQTSTYSNGLPRKKRSIHVRNRYYEVYSGYILLYVRAPKNNWSVYFGGNEQHSSFRNTLVEDKCQGCMSDAWALLMRVCTPKKSMRTVSPADRKSVRRQHLFIDRNIFVVVKDRKAGQTVD